MQVGADQLADAYAALRQAITDQRVDLRELADGLGSSLDVVRAAPRHAEADAADPTAQPRDPVEASHSEALQEFMAGSGCQIGIAGWTVDYEVDVTDVPGAYVSVWRDITAVGGVRHRAAAVAYRMDGTIARLLPFKRTRRLTTVPIASSRRMEDGSNLA
jgi:hypothetical protein